VVHTVSLSLRARGRGATLYFYDCDVSGTLKLEHLTGGSTEDTGAAAILCGFTLVVKAARRPEHAPFGSFLASRTLSPEKLARLRSLLPVPTGGRISDAHW